MGEALVTVPSTLTMNLVHIHPTFTSPLRTTSAGCTTCFPTEQEVHGALVPSSSPLPSIYLQMRSFRSSLGVTNIPLCIFAHFLDPFTSCRLSGLLLSLCSCEWCCSEHGCTDGPIIFWLTVLQVYAQKWNGWVMRLSWFTLPPGGNTGS